MLTCNLGNQSRATFRSVAVSSIEHCSDVPTRQFQWLCILRSLHPYRVALLCIAALSELRLLEERSLQEHGAKYILFPSGKPVTERRLRRRLYGQDFNCLQAGNLPTGHCDRIISMCLCLRNQPYALHCVCADSSGLWKKPSSIWNTLTFSRASLQITRS